ncbi:hypothetical protein EYF80_036782 [Liparis tanakae]|uniref:Uncharacterized protein n=1 Tax=Liparis tanakae TaxID=230148 RepID=A0A4Z2GJC3_9TELE|nr:hypothetical protein EYF80_036782 [Liparis tanakae]
MRTDHKPRSDVREHLQMRDLLQEAKGARQQFIQRAAAAEIPATHGNIQSRSSEKEEEEVEEEEDSDGWWWSGEVFPFQTVVKSNKLWVTAGQ